MKKTEALLAVAAALMQNPGGRHWGYDLSVQAGIRSGVMYPLLKRLLNEGWLEDGWEDPQTIEGRPPRRYYTLTEKGQRELGGLAAQAARPVPRATTRHGLAFASGFTQ